MLVGTKTQAAVAAAAAADHLFDSVALAAEAIQPSTAVEDRY